MASTDADRLAHLNRALRAPGNRAVSTSTVAASAPFCGPNTAILAFRQS
ncbi:hypothetical protein [Kineococcus sp. SYSU DK003]